MLKRIVNPTYGYQPGGNISIGCTLEILADDGVTVIESKSMASNANISSPNWKPLMKASFVTQFQDHIDTYKALAQALLPLFPGATSFDSAAQLFVSEIDAEVTI